MGVVGVWGEVMVKGGVMIREGMMMSGVRGVRMYVYMVAAGDVHADYTCHVHMYTTHQHTHLLIFQQCACGDCCCTQDGTTNGVWSQEFPKCI